ncbi:MAG: hypothetical protein ACREEM_46515 [Blastocatellia bacterium]
MMQHRLFLWLSFCLAFVCLLSPRAAAQTCQPPGVTAQPANQAVCSGAPASFSVTTSGTGPFSYQWRKNGVAIGGATGASYSIAFANPGDAGNYDVVISNACGMVTSAASLVANSFALSETSASFPASGGPGAVNVIATVNQCSWAATSSVNWVVFNSGGSGTGSGVINYTVAANSDPNARSGAITIGGLSFTFILQSGATPRITALSRESAIIGDAAFTLAVTGANFINGSKARWNGSERTTSFINSTQLTAEITLADLATAGTFNIDVFNPPPGAGPSNALPFTVTQDIEGDVSPRPTGNGSVTISDWVQVGRFAAGLDTPANGGEFQRADCSPRSCGNGVISISDWVQAGRYATGLDPIAPACGPTMPPAILAAGTFPLRDVWAEGLQQLRAPNPRRLRLMRSGDGPGEGMDATRSIVIALDALGQENSLGFSVNFDAARWRVASIAAGADAADARIMSNTRQASSGRIGIALALPTGESWSAGRRQIAVINFASISGDDPELTSLGFADQPVAREIVDAQANALPASYAPILLDGARPLAIVSAASFSSSALASESIAAAFGSDLAFTTQSAETPLLPTQLGGAQALVRDSQGVERQAPLFFVSPGQINFLIPAGTAPGAAIVTISNERGLAASSAIEIAEVAPSLFPVDASGQGLAAGVALRVKADGSQSYEPVAQFDPAQSKFVALPIDLGPETDQVFLILFGTGIRYRSSLSAMFASLGGVDAPVTFAGALDGFVGLDQVNTRLSRSLIGRGEIDVTLTVDGQTANTVRVGIK